MAERRLRKIDRLRQGLAASDGSLDDVKRIAASLNYLEDRYLARPAAEILVERGDPQAGALSAGLAMRPVLGREPHGDLLRAAFKKALTSEGIPPDVEANARRFYAGRGGRTHQQQGTDWIATSDTGGFLSFIRRLFGSS